MREIVGHWLLSCIQILLAGSASSPPLFPECAFVDERTLHARALNLRLSTTD